MPTGVTGPGTVLPPAPPPTGSGELLSSVPMNGLTYWVSGRTAAWAAVGHVTSTPVTTSRLATIELRRRARAAGAGRTDRTMDMLTPHVGQRLAGHRGRAGSSAEGQAMGAAAAKGAARTVMLSGMSQVHRC